jgi:hypothetical protein
MLTKNSCRMFESLETRQFCDNAYFASVLFGDNGDDYGVPTSAMGVGNDIQGIAYRNWDPDLADGMDSENFDFVFSINTNSSPCATLSVANDDSGEFSISPMIEVHSVQLRAAVAGPGMEFVFSNIQIRFYSGSSIVEIVRVDDLAADTRGAWSWDPAEATAIVTPTAANISGVKVLGTFQMKADAGVYPGPTDISGQVIVS